jgi:hypothetical protein
VAQFDSIRFQPSRPLLKEVSADRLNAILSEIKKNRPRGERGITVRQAGDATYIGLAANLKGGGKGVRTMPWDITIEEAEGEEDNITYTLKVIPGTLAGILPANWEDEFTANSDDLFYGIAEVTTDGTYITSVTINITTDEPEFQEAAEWGLPESVDILFGLFKDGQSYNVTGGQNLDVYGKNVMISTDEAAEIGDPVYTLWFKLQ